MAGWLSKAKLSFRFLRIKDWRAYLLIVVLGFFLSKGFLFPFWKISFFWLIVFLFLGFGFSINECFDTKEDKYHIEKGKLFIGKNLSFKKGVLLSLLLGISALILSLFFGLDVFLFSLLCLLLGFFYSVPPLRFKEKPFLDLISHGMFAGALIFLFSFIFFKAKIEPIHFLAAISIFYLSMILELRNHLEDYFSDLKAGLKTTACVLGYEKAEKFLRYLAYFYPLVLFPLFLFSSRFFFLVSFTCLTSLFLVLFLVSKKPDLISKKPDLKKDYRIFDLYTFLSLSLLFFMN
jgi:4-hydroxybenzoate polyprenyltransferase